MRYQRDGTMAGICPAHGHDSDLLRTPNFYPNDRATEDAPVPAPEYEAPPMPVLADAWTKFTTGA